MEILRINQDKKMLKLFAFGDTHMDSRLYDAQAFQHDMRRAKKEGRRCITTGDIFNAVKLNDPRYMKHTLHKRFMDSGDDAVMDAIVDYAFTQIDPYFDMIDVMSIGNHEATMIKHDGTNLVTRLIKMLNDKHSHESHRIQYGTNMYYLVYRFRIKATSTKLYTILVHHGTANMGKSKGLSCVSKFREAGYIYDLFLFGHGHQFVATRGVWVRPMVDRMYAEDYDLQVTKCRAVQTGTYKKNILRGDSTWEEDKAFELAEIGGAFITVKCKQRSLKPWAEDKRCSKREYLFETRTEV